MTQGTLGTEAGQANQGHIKGIFVHKVKKFGLYQKGVENPLKEYKYGCGITLFVF